MNDLTPEQTAIKALLHSPFAMAALKENDPKTWGLFHRLTASEFVWNEQAKLVLSQTLQDHPGVFVSRIEALASAALEELLTPLMAGELPDADDSLEATLVGYLDELWTEGYEVPLNRVCFHFNEAGLDTSDIILYIHNNLVAYGL